MARAIDANKAIEVAQIKYNDWNLAMAAADGQKEINLCFKKQELFKAVKAVLECVPTLTQPNEALTLEQLREMDGEPVWVEDVKHWALIDIEKDGQWAGIPFAVWEENGVEFTYNIEDRNLQCYRRPPEGDA